MQVLHISDWHTDRDGAEAMTQIDNLASDDVELVCITGDMIRNYTDDLPMPGNHEKEAKRQRGEWLRMVPVFEAAWPYADIVAVPGNHDFCNYAIRGKVRSFDKIDTKTIKVRGLKISGFRGIPAFTDYWHGELSDRTVSLLYASMDPSADIFMSHTPPYSILDAVNEWRFAGAFGMAEWFIENPWIKRRFHLFGHIHECGGMTKEQYGMCFSNASGCYNILEIK
jgi:Icc-related predicted phosphoesterase